MYTPVLIDHRRKPRSEETKEKIRLTLTGRKLGPYPKERGEAISRAKKGVPANSPRQLEAHRKSSEKMKGRAPWNKGKTLGPQAPELIEKRRLAGTGLKRSAEACKAISDGRKGMQFSAEHRRSLSDAAQKRAARGIFPHWISKLEQSLLEVLTPLGFKTQFRLGFGSRPFDYGNEQTKTLVEVNGCYWHAHGCAIGSLPNQAEIRERDMAAEQFAADRGYRVIWLWECGKENWETLLVNEGIIPSSLQEVAA